MNIDSCSQTNEDSNKSAIIKVSLLRSDKILFVADAGLAQSMTNLCTGAFLTAYALYLGGDYFSIGIPNRASVLGY